MKRIAPILMLLPSLLLGCMPKIDESNWVAAETGVHQLYAKDCKGFVVPDAAAIKSANVSIRYSQATLDQVWDAAVILLMQESIIIHAEKTQRSGLLATFTGPLFLNTTVNMPNIGLQKWVQNVTYARPPLVVLLEEEGTERVSVYLYWMQNLYDNVNEPKIRLVEFPQDLVEREGKELFDKLSTQVYATEKWKYLYSDKGK